MKKFLKKWWEAEWHLKWKRLGLHVDSTPKEIRNGRIYMYLLIGWALYEHVQRTRNAKAIATVVDALEDLDLEVDIDLDKDLPLRAGEHLQVLVEQWRESIPHHIGAFGLASAQEHFGVEAVNEYFREIRSQENRMNMTREG